MSGACALEFGDILKEIPDEDLPELAKLYKTYEEVIPQVYGFVKTAIKSKKSGMKDFVKVTSPNNSWREDGTIVGIVRTNDLNCQVFLHTLDKQAKNLVEGLTKTKLIPLSGKSKGCVMFYSVHESLNKAVENFLKNDKKLEFFEHGKWTTNYRLKKEIAAKSKPELPLDAEVYVNTLDLKDADLINDLWPHKSEGTVDLVRDLIKLNKGFGLYLKSNNQLVSWMCVSIFGQLSLLYTLPEHRRKGYGMYLLQYTAKYLAEVEELHALGTIVLSNKPSKRMFEKAGFEPLHLVNFMAVHM